MGDDDTTFFKGVLDVLAARDPDEEWYLGNISERSAQVRTPAPRQRPRSRSAHIATVPAKCGHLPSP